MQMNLLTMTFKGQTTDIFLISFIHSFVSQLPRVCPNIDAALHQKLLNDHRHATAQIEDDLEHQRKRQEADLQVSYCYTYLS